LIQIAEQLEAPEQILEQSYSNAAWQNASFGAATACARGAAGAIENLGHRLGALGYIEQATQNGEILAKLPLQYIENHDHSRSFASSASVTGMEIRYLQRVTAGNGTGFNPT
jgi:maltooligosyltrehalose trehalohydrolase